VFGKLLALGEAEGDRLEPVVVEQGAAQDALVGRLDLLRQIGEKGVTSRGFRRSAPALVFTMMNLADKGLAACREEIRVVDGVEVKDRYYRSLK
jgi:hypothetical protein